MSTRFTIAILSLLILGCPRTTQPPSTESGFTDGPPQATTRPATSEPPPPPERCPGGAQCPCSDGCSEGLMCGPHQACTKSCATNADCDSGIDGEVCITNLCAVVCEPDITPSGGCVEAGVNAGSTCLTIFGVNVCGYEL